VYHVPTTTTILASYPDHRVGIIEASWDLPRNIQQLEVFGDRGSVDLVSNSGSQLIRFETWQGRERREVPLAVLEPHWADPATYFAYAVRRGQVDEFVGAAFHTDVMAILEATEQLVAQGYTPRRTLMLSFGHSEEKGGPSMPRFMATLAARGVKPHVVIDEGGFVTEGVVAGVTAMRSPSPAPCAMSSRTSGRLRQSPPLRTKTTGPNSRTFVIIAFASSVDNSSGRRYGTASARQCRHARSHARVVSQMTTNGDLLKSKCEIPIRARPWCCTSVST
jgi:hypothetical protein